MEGGELYVPFYSERINVPHARFDPPKQSVTQSIETKQALYLQATTAGLVVPSFPF